MRARFDTKGARLVCREMTTPDARQIVVHKVPSEQHQELGNGLTMKSPGYFTPLVGFDSCCFAGDNDELVVAASKENNLHIWSIPDEQSIIGNRKTADQSLLSLRGHQKRISCVRYCKATSLLASCDASGIIKLWSPTEKESSYWFNSFIGYFSIVLFKARLMFQYRRFCCSQFLTFFVHLFSCSYFRDIYFIIIRF